MNRPTEQLIRDFLNRLSLAAKTRLEPGDRQGLLDHTRARIDSECGGITNPSAAQVRRTLAGLGDPMALVEKERSRVAVRKAWDERAASRGRPDVGSAAGQAPAAEGQPEKQPEKQESRFGSRASGSLRQVWPPPASPVRAQRSLMPPVILPSATANLQVSAVRPVTVASQPVSTALPVSASPPRPAALPVSASRPIPAGQPVPVGSLAPAAGSPTGANRAASAAVPVAVDSPTAKTPPAPAVPCEPGNPVVLASAAAADDAPDGAKPARPTSPTEPRGLPPARGGVPRPRGVPPVGNASASGAEPAPPGGAGRGAGGSSGSNGLSSRPPAPRRAPESAGPPSVQPGRAGAAGSDKPDQEPGQQRRPEAPTGGQPDGDVPGVEFSIDPVDFEVVPSRVAEVGDALVRWLRRFGKALLTIALRDRLEAVSLLLLGIGGAFYPPIWLVGAAVAVASRKWDLRDKWIGLVLPVLVVILGATLTVTFGSQQTSYKSYLVEGWVAASRLSRAAAVLGAIYLLWRVYKYGGSKSRRLPPWSPQRKPGR
jgi:hypothetical protein